MTRYEFSVIKYVPDIARFEPVNIGVALMDKENMVVHNRFITDFGRFFARLGVDRINGLERSFERLTSEVSVDKKDCLWKIHEDSNGSMFYSKPTTVARPGEMSDPKSMLGLVFDKMISVQDRLDTPSESSKAIIKKKIRIYYKSGIPNDAIVESFTNQTLGYTAVRDFAFLKDGLPKATIDVFDSFVSLEASIYRLFLHEINEMNHSKSHKIKPFIFTSKDSRGRNNYEKDADTLKEQGISIVEPDRHAEVMDEIKAVIC